MNILRIASIALISAFGLLSLHASAQVSEKSWWDDTPWVDPDRGFNWYPPDAPPAPKAKAEKTPAERMKARAPRNLSEIASVKEMTEELDWRKQVAIWAPSQQNVYSYLEAQKFAMDKSSMFADVWRRTIWQSGELSYADKTPVINAQANNDREYATEKRMRTLQELSKDYGIVFFYKNDCRYCHDQAPILKLFQKSYGMDVMPISLDGQVGRMAQMFPNSKVDNGISQVVTGGSGINRWPVLYLVSRKTKRAVQIATGVLDAEQIAERVRVMATTAPGEEL